MDISSRFNETGVKLYQEGRGSEAFDLFHASIEVQLLTEGRTTASLDPLQCQSLAFFDAIAQALKKDFYERSNSMQFFLNPPDFTNDVNVVSPAHSNPTCTPMDTRHPRPSLSKQSSNTEDPCLFDKVFEWTAPLCPNYDHYVVALAMDLYNMALILQKGMMNSKMIHCLERSLLLYSYAADLLWKNLGLVRPFHCGTTPLSTVYCAILNNTGYVLHQMGRFDWSQLFFFRLNKVLEMLGPAESVSEQSDRDAFQLNVIALYGTWASAASA